MIALAHKPHVIAVLAAHNRKALTLQAINDLLSENQAANVRIILVDSSSSDGTVEDVKMRHPQVHIIPTDSQMFWAGAMRIGMCAAIKQSPDYILWMNDDVRLSAGALDRLLATQGSTHSIIVGAFSGTHGQTTYSAYKRAGRGAMRLMLVEPVDAPQVVDTMNGNLVLIPKIAFQTLGTLSYPYSHGMADLDYGYRAHRAGLGPILASGTFGICERNMTDNIYLSLDMTARDKWRYLFGPKGLPIRPHVALERTWGGPLWPVYFARKYVRATGEILIAGTRRFLLARRKT